MKKGLYAIYDSKAEEVVGNVIHILKHSAVAVRMFTDVMQNAKSIISQHPEDYDLVELGVLSDDEQTIEPTAPENRIVLAGAALKNILEQQAKNNLTMVPEEQNS